jgi:hypothetical protein
VSAVTDWFDELAHAHTLLPVHADAANEALVELSA